MKSLGRTVASFYWQLTRTINQDIPLDEQGTPAEFERYVGYFIYRRPEFQGELADTLNQMAVDNYLEALHTGKESRAFIRRASRKAATLTRRSRSLAGIRIDTISGDEENPESIGTVSLLDATPYTVQDTVEALLLDNGMPLVEYVLDSVVSQSDGETGIQGANTRVPDPVQGYDGRANEPLQEWLVALQRFMEARAGGRNAADSEHLLSELRAASDRLLPAESGPGWGSRISDQAEAVVDVVSAWCRSLAAGPGAALTNLGREMRALPRMVPSVIFLTANVLLYIWIAWQSVGQVETGWGVLALVGSVAAFLWATDALTYAVHLERDGWGDGPMARAFQDHHDYPDEVGLWTVRRSVGTTGSTVLPLMLVLAIAEPHFTVAVGLATAIMGIIFATQTHRFAHQPLEEIPGWVRALQKLHLSLPVHRHAIHHDHLDRSWGIFNGWSNPLLDRIGYRDRYIRLRTRLFGDTRPLWESQLAAREALGDH